MTYESPKVVDYGDVRAITAARVFQQDSRTSRLRASRRSRGLGLVDDTTGPCRTDLPAGLCVD